LGLTFGELRGTPLLHPISFAAGDHGLQRVAFKSLEQLKVEMENKGDDPSLKGMETVQILMNELKAYFSGDPIRFSVDIDWDTMDAFQRRILHSVCTIPYRKLWHYQGIRSRLATSNFTPTPFKVFWAVTKNPVPIVIPCHRVIRHDKRLQGYVGPLRDKETLLRIEGHKMEMDRVIE